MAGREGVPLPLGATSLGEPGSRTRALSLAGASGSLIDPLGPVSSRWGTLGSPQSSTWRLESGLEALGTALQVTKVTPGPEQREGRGALLDLPVRF